MDERKPLARHTKLGFAGMECVVEHPIGRGSNAIVYKGWYPDRLNPDQVHHVLIKELFPYDPRGGIYRGEDGFVYVEEAARTRFEDHRQSFLAGNEIHLRLLADHPEQPGGNLNSFEKNGTLYTVLSFSGGRTLEKELADCPMNLKTAGARMVGLLDGLEAFHKSGWLHLDISPDNIMLTGSGSGERIFLIDYNSARPAQGTGPFPVSVKQGYSPPEVELDSPGKVGFSSDLYSVAAVFYRCLMGRPMTLSERLKSKAPDGGDSPLLAGANQSVTAWVRTILRKGLNVLPEKRYQSIGQMRRAFVELLDRIDCVGITHWALWETGKGRLEERIRLNPSLRYLDDIRELYPVRLEVEGQSLGLEEYVSRMLAPEGHSGIIVAGGGMGKTTLLLRAARSCLGRYSPSAPAVIYIPLSGREPGQNHYIRDRILAQLRFRGGENTYATAVNQLERLLSCPLKGRNGETPAVLLLLDGLNEMRGDPAPVYREIKRLNALGGVRIITASRSGVPQLELTCAAIAPLTDEDIAQALGKRGLLMPEEKDALELLRTPLVLSLCIRGGLSGDKLSAGQKGLLSAYLSALVEKEQRLLAEDSPERWRIEAAVEYVLPAVARNQTRLGRGLTDEQLLAVVKRCHRTIGSRQLNRAFPGWIGRSGDILGGDRNPEVWYGLVIHEILWRRLGLLLREQDGRWQICHQMICEHLDRMERHRFGVYRIRRAGAAAVLLGTLALGMLWIAGAGYHNSEDARRAVEYSAGGYAACGRQYRDLTELVQRAVELDQTGFDAIYESVEGRIGAEAELSRTERLYLDHLENNILPGGEKRIRWSGERFDTDLAVELTQRATQRAAYYAPLLPLLRGWMDSPGARALCPDYPRRFADVLEADAALSAELYHQVCVIHLDEDGAQWQRNIRKLIAGISEQDSHRVLIELEDRTQLLENLRSALADAQGALAREGKMLELALSGGA